MGATCSLSAFGVSLPKEVYIQNHRLGFLLLFARLVALAFCVHIILQSSAKAWLRSELPIGTVSAWAETGNYSSQAEVDMRAVYCDDSLNDKLNYWYSSSWTYTNFSCRTLPPGERSVKRQGEIYIPTSFQETVAETRVANKTKNVSCESACVLQGSCPHTVHRATGNDVFKFSGSLNDFGQCLCKCEISRNVFVAGVSALEVALETMVEVREDGNLNTLRKYFSAKGEEDVLTVVRKLEGSALVEVRRFQPGEIVQLSLYDWLKLGAVESLDDVNDQTLANWNADPKYQKYPVLRITGAEVILKVNYHNELDPLHQTPWNGPVCYIDVSVRKVWSSRPVMDWGVVEDSQGVGRYRYRYYYGIRFVFDSKGHFSFWNPMGVFTMLASIVVYLSLPNTAMVYFTRYCLGTLSTIYYNAQVQVLQIGHLLSGLLSRALVGKTCYEMLLRRDRHGAEDDGLSTEKLGLHLDELFEHEKRLDQHEIATMNSIFVESLGSTKDGVIGRSTFVEAFTNSEECTLRELVDLFDDDASANPCMVMFDDSRKQRHDMVCAARGLENEKAPPFVRKSLPFLLGQRAQSPKDLEPSPMPKDAEAEMFRQLFVSVPEDSNKDLTEDLEVVISDSIPEHINNEIEVAKFVSKKKETAKFASVILERNNKVAKDDDELARHVCFSGPIDIDGVALGVIGSAKFASDPNTDNAVNDDLENAHWEL